MQHLWNFPRSQGNKVNNDPPRTLLAIAVGIKQKKIVDKIVKKFSSIHSTVMLFHYDGFVNEWKDLQWVDRALHVSVANQTKWWFAKRFLHPDIVAEYDYIFLWNENLIVNYFDPKRYLSIVEKEQLEISQPDVDLSKSEVHHKISVRAKKFKFHGWVEMRAPVFSKTAWRCAWYLIQGDTTKNVGVMDMQCIAHSGILNPGVSGDAKAPQC